jgi:hypothetical protein
VPYKALPPRTIYLLEEEAEAAICLHGDFDVVHCEPLGDGRLQIGDRASCRGVDIGGGTVVPVHDEGSPVHVFLTELDKSLVRNPTSPSGIYVRVWQE